MRDRRPISKKKISHNALFSCSSMPKAYETTDAVAK